MTKMVNMEFDGRAVQVPEGMTLVDAAATVGVHIPNLCHIKELRGVGACRMCMVEIEGMKTPVTACTTRTKEGMKVQTKTPKVEEIRKFVVDLVLSFHPLDCMTCPKAGACDLQRYAADLGIRESSFGRKSFNYELNDKSPLITIDNNYCILCGRCVRVCKEQGTNVLDFMGRGITSKVTTAMDKPLHESGCTFCGSCIDACPVNCIMEQDRWQHGREWDLEKRETVCTACASGCSVIVSKKDGRIVKVNAKEDNGYICVIGRFGFDSLKAQSRITSPLVRQGGKLVPASWEDAIAKAAELLKKAGADAGFIVSGSLTNEDAYALQSLARETVGSANIDTTSSVYANGLLSALRTMYGENGIGIAANADLESSDCVVVIGANPSQKKQSLQEVDVMIRRRGQAGAKLIIIDPEKTDLASHQNAMHLRLKQGTDSALLSGLMSAAIAEGANPGSAKGLDGLRKSLINVEDAASQSGVAAQAIQDAAKAYAAAKHPVIVIGTGVALDENACIHTLNLGLLKAAGIIPLWLESNALGVMHAGCLPDAGPGFSGLKKAGKGYAEMKSGMKTLVVAGPVPDKDFKAGALIVIAGHMGSLAERADVVLPSASLYEKEGTITNVYGIKKEFRPAVEPALGARSAAEIAAEISMAVSKTKGFKLKEAQQAAKKLKHGKLGAASFKSVRPSAAGKKAVSGSSLLAALNEPMISASKVSAVIRVPELSLR